MSREKQIITEFESRHQFLDFLKENPDHIIVKFGAEWCGPCKNIESNVKSFFLKCPHTVICCDIDVDESFDLYAYLKTKKMVNGIPAILVWEKGTTSYIPDHSYVGGDPNGFEEFAQSMLSKFSNRRA